MGQQGARWYRLPAPQSGAGKISFATWNGALEIPSARRFDGPARERSRPGHRRLQSSRHRTMNDHRRPSGTAGSYRPADRHPARPADLLLTAKLRQMDVNMISRKAFTG